MAMVLARRLLPTLIALAAGSAACAGGSTTAAPGVESVATSSPADDAAEDAASAPTSRPPRTSGATVATTTTSAAPRPVVPATTTTATSLAPTSAPTTVGDGAAPSGSGPSDTAPVSTPVSTPLPAPGPASMATPDPSFAATHAAIDRLAATNPALSVVVRRGGEPVVVRATGTTIGGAPATTASPMVVASVSKVVTALAVARLDQQDRLDVGAPVDWSLLGFDPHPGWDTVTVRELLDHTSGMPTVRASWFDQPGDCASFLPSLLVEPPQDDRGRWRYSNGNYCALGLLVEAITGRPLDDATAQLVFDPIGVPGAHLSTGGQLPGDVQYGIGDPVLAAKGVDRLSRLGGAGSLIVANDSLAAMVDTMTAQDWAVLRWPGMFIDQYGIGHTGTVDGAKACVWQMESGNTVLAATVGGKTPSTGGGVCDVLVPAIATDLGAPAPTPDRTPP